VKQKILLGASSQSNKTRFHKRLQAFLNAQHEYFLSFLFLDYFQELIFTQSESLNEHLSSAQIVKKIEFEVDVETLPANSNFNIDVFKSTLNSPTLNGLTTVADLMIIDGEIYKNYNECHKIRALVSNVNCPVLVLPEGNAVSRIIMVHDPALHSIAMVKDFLRLFNQDLTKLPLTVLFAFPDSEEQTENEKYFVDYLKMAFPNLGMQLIVNDPMEELLDNFNSETSNALIMVSNDLAYDIFDCHDNKSNPVSCAPFFINKH
jgi:hypothetical protein